MAGFSGAIGSLWVEIGARINDFQEKMRQVSSEIKDVVREASTQLSALDIGKGLAGIGAAVSAALTPFLLFGKAAVEAAADMDSLTRGLGVVATASDTTAMQLGRLKEIAKLPGLGLKEAIEGSINLQAAGSSAAFAEKAMLAFGNALAAVGKGKTDLTAVITQLTQMSNKAKVVAGDLKPIMERVPQVATIVRQAFGTIDTEVIQKMGVSTKDFINVVIGELEKLPKVSGGIKNSFENLSDSLTEMKVKFGNLFIPLIEKATPLIEALIAKAGELADWFGSLPEPIKAGAAAFAIMIPILAGLTTVVGAALIAWSSFTALFASGGLLAGLGVTAAGFSGVALAIPLVLAALTALGAWVYTNWEPIVAVVKQAWDGLSEIWGAAFDGAVAIIGPILSPIVDTFQGIWSAVVDVFDLVRDAVVNNLDLIAIALAPILAPAALAAAAIVAVGYALIELGKWVYDNWPAITESVSSAWNAVYANWTDAWSNIITGIVAIWEGVAGIAEATWANVTSVFATIWDGVSSVWTTVWSAITDRLKAQWDELSGHVEAIWNPIAKFFTSIWDGIAGYFASAWNAVANTLTSVWNGIKQTALSVWSAITGAIGTFLEAAAKVPGVNKLLNLDAAWTSAKKASEELKNAGAATTGLATSANAGATHVAKYTGAVTALGKSTKETTEHLKAVTFQSESYKLRLQELEDAHRTMGKEILEGRAALKALGDTLPTVIQPTDALTESIQRLVSSAKLVSPAFLDAGKQAAEAMRSAVEPVQQLDDAYKKLGITSSASLKDQADAAGEAYLTIFRSSDSTVRDIDVAWDKYEKARITAAKAAGEEIPAEDQKALDRMEEQLGNHQKKQVSQWEGFSKQVSTIISDAGKNIVDRFAKLGDINDKLDEQAAKLKDSLAERETAYADFAQNIQQSLAEANAGYADTLKKEESDLQASLKDRQDAYESFAKDVADKLSDLKAKHEKEADKERNAILKGLDNKTGDFEDYKGDIQDKIAGISKTQQEAAAKERAALSSSLAGRKVDYDRYVEDALTKLGRIREKNKGVYSDEEADLLKSLARRTEDFNSFTAENATAMQAVTTKHADAEAAQIASAKASLDKKLKDFEQYQADVASKLDEVTKKHQEEQAKEEADLQKSLDKKKDALDKYTVDATAKFESVRQAAADKLEKQTSDLQTKLAEQTTAWEKYKTDVETQLAGIEEKHLGIFGKIAAVGKGIFEDLAGSIGRFVSETLVGKLFKTLGDLVTDVLPGVGAALGKVFGSAASAAGSAIGGIADNAEALGGAAAQAGGGAGSAAGSAGSGAAGIAGSGLTAMVGAIGSVAGAVSGIIGNFQNAHQETSLNAIEHNTRFSMMYLGERSDGGILGTLFRVQENTAFINPLLDGVNKKLDDWLAPLNQQLTYLNTTGNALGVKLDTWLEPLGNRLTEIYERADLGITKMSEISTNTSSGAQADRDNNGVLNQMLNELRLMSQKSPIINVYVAGVQQPTSSTAPGALKMQGVLGV